MYKLITYSLFTFLAILCICSCSVEKYIPENEKLFLGSTLTIKSEDTVKNLAEIESSIENLLRPKPNSKLLGVRWGLLAHYKAQREKPGFFYKFLNKKIGEDPVYLSMVDQENTKDLLDNRLENRGFFKNSTTDSIKASETRASVHYDVAVRKPYRLATYQLDTMPDVIQPVIAATLPKTLLKEKDRFDLTLFKLERERIDQRLKRKGFYNFNADFLIFEADTNQYKDKRFDLFLRLKKEVPNKSIVPYIVKTINVYPNYNSVDSIALDTTKINGINYLQSPEFFKPKRLAPYFTIQPNQRYDPEASKRTSRRLASIGTYKFVNIQYEPLDSINDGQTPKLLKANVFLSPLNRRALRFELQAVTKSNNFSGPSLVTRYSNRNLFHSGETLNIAASVGYETQVGGGANNIGLTSLQLGLSSTLIFPRLLFPIKINSPFEYEIPSTRISLGFEILDRSKLYRLNSVNTTLGYGWNANRFVYHELNPISINYVNLSNTTPAFDDILDANPFLRSSFDQQFIAGLTYTFIYNELNDADLKNKFFTKFNFDIAGNLLNAFAKENEDSTQPKTIFGLEYAQYAKADIDLRYYFGLGKQRQFITRLYGGIGLPYGNSTTLPFSKQYFSGGPYSVRAFRIRSLGPGKYQPQTASSNDFFDRSGDIRLEANLEYRFPLFPFVFGAAFVDAGNVWLTEANDVLEGGELGKDFLGDLGIGGGVGVRVDIQNFVIRFDLAAPIQIPDRRIRFDGKNPILNFAIGYPF